jgi:ATP-dependent DNA helicase PIF1
MDIAEQILNDRRNTFISGPGGCGKSYIIKAIMKQRTSGTTICTATTGIAAIPIEGHTLHRALGLGLFKGKVSSLYAQMEKRKGLVKKWREAQELIIDEISMMDISVFVRASALMSLIRDDPRPWGGLRLILSGDFLQLPPVEHYSDGGINYKYLFQHPIWEELDLHTIVLNEPHRFTTRHFFDVLNDARYGILSDRLKEVVKGCSRPPERHKTGITPTVIFSTNVDVDDFNNKKLAQLPGEEHKYEALFRSTFRGSDIPVKKEMKDRLLKDTRAQENLILKVGAQVMLMVNTLNDSLCNGSRGVVVGFREADDVPIVRFLNEMELPIKINTWTIGSPREVDGDLEWESHKIVQLPIRLAYAATAHKTQGMTLDSAYLCMDRCFVPNHIYVMLSRCKDPQHIFIKGWSEQKFAECSPDKDAIKLYRDLDKKLGR